MRIEIFDSISKIDAAEWNALLHNNNPLISHSFLAALENTGCLGKEFGWFPVFFTLYQDNKLLAACPAYIKTNSYGEFVFDMAWADFYQNHQQAYYPKLVCAIPYSPVNGERFLCAPGLDKKQAGILLSQAIKDFCQQQQLSGAHILFHTRQEQQLLQQQGWLTRKACQYHWFNHNYQSFDDFLQDMSAKKRKNIRQERKAIHRQGLTLIQKFGHQLDEQEISQVHHFYRSTFDKKWGYATLSLDFFRQISRQLKQQMLIVFAYHQQQTVACAIFFVSDHALYGRYWGCDRYFEHLHFEACYYQGIEFCIQNGLRLFEPGAQGEHKIPRGFVPTTTWSSHWLQNQAFFDIISRHVHHENQLMMEHCEELKKRLPFKKTVT